MLNLKILKRYTDTKSGYVKLYLEDFSVVEEHRYIMTHFLNRELSYNEIVHHIDGNKQNNNIKNLELKTRSEHAKNHATKDFNDINIELICPICNNTFYLKKSQYKYRVKNGQKTFCCCREHSFKNQKKH